MVDSLIQKRYMIHQTSASHIGVEDLHVCIMEIILLIHFNVVGFF